MPSPAFVRFGPAHLVVLLTVTTLASTLALAARRWDERARRRLCATLAVLLIAAQLAECLGAWWQQRLTLQHMPLQLCDVSAALAVWVLLRRDARVFEPLYFFALCATLPALLTPELAADFPDRRFFDYFASHGLVVVATCVLMAGLGLRPARGAYLRAFVLLNGWAAVTGAINLVLGTNFLYLCRKPVDPTLFDALAPWPTYLVQLEFVALLAFYLAELPWRHVTPRRPALGSVPVRPGATL
jgi:hypothetical integral membrane protein (TIGR02206 family)